MSIFVPIITRQFAKGKYLGHNEFNIASGNEGSDNMSNITVMKKPILTVL